MSVPPCGAAHQPCCPPNAGGVFKEYSITGQQTPMPYCIDPDSTCLWAPAATDFAQALPENDLQPKPPQASYSMSVTFPKATCIPGLKQCGRAGQPCCPHAQFAVSNAKMFFRSHVCDLGLKCDATINLAASPPVLGICQGEEQQCGQVGQKCCEHTDGAGWTWKTCLDGQPGVYCSQAQGVCKVCPSGSTRMSAAQAADVGNAC